MNLLSKAARAEFMALHLDLLYEVYLHTELAEPDPLDIEDFAMMPNAWRIPFHNTLASCPEVIDYYLQDQGDRLNKRQFQTVNQWKHAKGGGFAITKHTSEYTVLIDLENMDRVYAVKGISEPIIDIVGSSLPVFAGTILLPFRGEIVFDGFFRMYREGNFPTPNDCMSAIDRADRDGTIITDLLKAPKSNP